MTEETVALMLLALVAIAELLKTKDDPVEWVLDTYARCLADAQQMDVVLQRR
jgi:hypothetical protein